MLAVSGVVEPSAVGLKTLDSITFTFFETYEGTPTEFATNLQTLEHAPQVTRLADLEYTAQRIHFLQMMQGSFRSLQIRLGHSRREVMD